jgi:hypothetical protein
MAAFSDRMLVWSATLVMVISTLLMLLAFSDSAASLALIESVADTMCCMVRSMRLRLFCASAVALVV